jgi:hypothetical protein
VAGQLPQPDTIRSMSLRYRLFFFRRFQEIFSMMQKFLALLVAAAACLPMGLHASSPTQFKSLPLGTAMRN